MIREAGVRNFENSCFMYEKICLYCGIAAVVFLLLTLVLFFVLHISQVFGGLSGRTARRAVRRMTDGNLRRDKTMTGKKASGSRLCRDSNGRNDTSDRLVSRKRTAALTDIRRISAAFTVETAALPSEERRSAVPKQTQKNRRVQGISAAHKKDL